IPRRFGDALEKARGAPSQRRRGPRLHHDDIRRRTEVREALLEEVVDVAEVLDLAEIGEAEETRNEVDVASHARSQVCSRAKRRSLSSRAMKALRRSRPLRREPPELLLTDHLHAEAARPVELRAGLVTGNDKICSLADVVSRFAAEPANELLGVGAGQRLQR